MDIKKKGKRITLTAKSKEDSKDLLSVLRTMVGLDENGDKIK